MNLLFKVVKKMMPKTLFGRTFLILIMPLLMVQIISAYIFFERHWDDITRKMADVTASQISAVMEFITLEKTISAPLLPTLIKNFDFEIIKHPNAHFHLRDHSQFDVRKYERESILRIVFKRDFWEIFLIEALQRYLTDPFHVSVKRHKVVIEVKGIDGIYEFQVDRRHVFTGNTHIFMVWSIGTMVLFLIIAAFFLRKQIRPIQNLSEAAEKFGMGQTMAVLKPSGAVEVRKASITFLMMRERILRQIKQHTQMLAGVSHDLRTPLTRMKLQLAMLSNLPQSKDLEADVDEMESMIESYLAFAKSGDFGVMSESDLVEVIYDILPKVIDNQRKVIFVGMPESYDMVIQVSAFKRALSNIIQNADRFAEHIWLTFTQTDKYVILTIEDDGPGVPESSFEDIMRPFYRLEKSRNKQTGGIGLGLAIARNVAKNHGGDLVASSSSKGGLAIALSLRKGL
jgi:two-component system osmolarity sensor histidine kinase EnvZ